MKVKVKIMGQEPTVLKSRMAWFTWKGNFGNTAYGTEVWDKVPDFPCLALTHTDRNGYFLPTYLSMNDVEKMVIALEKATK